MATLREIQLCQLDILKEVAGICDGNGIPYWLAAGTFLGAVRHSGFIPWDDDVDIYMKYDDLKRFKKICKKELSEKYFYQDHQTDMASHWIFAKIRANGTSMSEQYGKDGMHADYHEGVWIDIFPLIEAADTPGKLEKQLTSIFEYQHFLYESWPIKKEMSIPAKLITLKGNMISKWRCYCHKKRFERLQSQSSDFLIVMANSYYAENSEAGRKKALTDIVYKNELVSSKYLFEGSLFSGFGDYNAYLSRLYGKDYMTPKQWAHLPDYDHVIL